MKKLFPLTEAILMLLLAIMVALVVGFGAAICYQLQDVEEAIFIRTPKVRFDKLNWNLTTVPGTIINLIEGEATNARTTER